MFKGRKVNMLKNSLKSVKEIVFRWEGFLILLLFVEIIIFGSLNPKFFRISLLLNSVNDFLVIGVIALSVTFVIITGGIDISAGAMIGLSSVVTGILWQEGGMNIWLACICAIFVGILCGMLNGYLVAYLRIQAMVATLGTSFLFSGIALVLMKLSGVSAYEGISGFPQAFKSLMGGEMISGIPNSIIIFLILIVLSSIILHRTKYGRYVFLTGINKNAAVYSGLNARLITASTYVLVGISASLAGILLSSYLNSSRSDFGAETTLSIITAVVLGGTAITGGKGSIFGTAVATIVIGLMKFGLQMARVPTQYTNIPTGILLIVAVAAAAVSGNIELKFRLKSMFSKFSLNRK